MITIISYNLAADISLSGSSGPLSPGCGVVDRGKSKDLQKNPFGATTTTNNKHNPCRLHVTAGPAIEPRT